MKNKNILKIPKYGTINVHASLLPKYRGAAPINWAIINGEKETGLTSFFNLSLRSGVGILAISRGSVPVARAINFFNYTFIYIGFKLIVIVLAMSLISHL